MATAQELVDLAGSLNNFAGGIDSFIDSQPNPYAQNLLTLRTLEGQIATSANQIAALAIANLAAEISASTKDLTNEVSKAQNVLKNIGNVQKAAQIVATVLSVAVAAASGNPFATAGRVEQLATQIAAVIS